MITRLEAFISGMVFMMPGFTSPIHSSSTDLDALWQQQSQIEAHSSDVQICSQILEGASRQAYSFRLPVESAVGETALKDWQYFLIESDNIAKLRDDLKSTQIAPENWSSGQQILLTQQGPEGNCVSPLQSPARGNPSYIM